jgi:hypothetical protein
MTLNENKTLFENFTTDYTGFHGVKKINSVLIRIIRGYQ